MVTEKSSAGFPGIGGTKVQNWHSVQRLRGGLKSSTLLKVPKPARRPGILDGSNPDRSPRGGLVSSTSKDWSRIGIL